MLSPTKTMASGKNAEMSGNRKKHCRRKLRSNGSLKGLKSLSEAIILQSIEDMFSPDHRNESLEFFSGNSFKVCSKLAGLDTKKQSEILFLMGGNKK
ncbi:MAG TPA: hypothetical protein ENG95_01710 [Nitrospirae bacterium]|nr:hypothetical protein BMS3Bbin08_01568 [bacterium BMS3Bbin08]HDH00693.1 hypothetical protein [Nitrospirota bacterium]HDK82028.1 hypothetical protein [Nitrospirota bacterium]HDO25345.1 hypothetical protein [Nitrospirota bacterium]